MSSVFLIKSRLPFIQKNRFISCVIKSYRSFHWITLNTSQEEEVFFFLHVYPSSIFSTELLTHYISNIIIALFGCQQKVNISPRVAFFYRWNNWITDFESKIIKKKLAMWLVRYLGLLFKKVRKFTFRINYRTFFSAG